MIRLPGIIPIQIDPLFWILAFGIGWLNTGSLPLTLIWGVVIVLSVLFHEFGHALTALVFGQNSTITLMAFGGVTRRQGGASLAKWKEFLVVLNGPLAGFFIAFFAWWAVTALDAKLHPVLGYALTVTYYVNFFWTIVNLFPIQPLDGGHLLLIMLQGAFGFRGVKIAYFLSIVIAGLLALACFFFQQVLMGALFMIFAYESFRGFKESLHMTKEDQSEGLQNDWKSAEEAYKNGNLEEAKFKLEEILKTSTKGILFFKATQMQAKILEEEGHYREAYEVLSPLEKDLEVDSLMFLQTLAFRTAHFREAARLGAKVHQDLGSPDVALVNALAHAELVEAKPAAGWLRTAIGEGLPNPMLAVKDTRFDKVRSDPAFQDLIRSLQQNS